MIIEPRGRRRERERERFIDHDHRLVFTQKAAHQHARKQALQQLHTLSILSLTRGNIGPAYTSSVIHPCLPSTLRIYS